MSALNKQATRFDFLITSQNIQRCVPDVYWMTVFGAPYVKMFGREKLLTAPVHKAEALDEKTVAVQLTPRLEDLRSDPAAFAETKRRLKTFLGDTAFFDPEQLGNCQRPEFVWR